MRIFIGAQGLIMFGVHEEKEVKETEGTDYDKVI